MYDTNLNLLWVQKNSERLRGGIGYIVVEEVWKSRLVWEYML